LLHLHLHPCGTLLLCVRGHLRVLPSCLQSLSLALVQQLGWGHTHTSVDVLYASCMVLLVGLHWSLLL